MFGIEVILDLVDHLTGPIRGPMGALSELEQHAQGVEAGLKRMASGAMFVGAGAILAAPFVVATRAAIDFESAMADVRKVVNFDSPEQFVQMKNDLMGLSEQIPVTAKGFAQIAAAAGQAGIARSEIVEFARDAAKMGVAFDLSADQAGSAMTGLRNIFRLTQGDVVLLGDSVNQLSNNMDAKASGILDVLSRAGSTGRLIGLTGQQVAALGATFIALKSPPEVAGTAINSLLMRMTTATQQGKVFQQGLKNIGLTALELAQHVRRDAQGALIDLLQRVRGSKDVVGVLNQLFGQEYSDDISRLVGGLGTYQQALKLVGDQAKYAGSMEKEYASRADTTANSLELLKNTAQNAGTTLGEILLPATRQLADDAQHVLVAVRAWSQAHPALAQGIVIVGLGVAGLLLLLGNAEIAIGGFTVGLHNMRAGLIVGRTRVLALSASFVKLAADARTASLAQSLTLQQNAVGLARWGLVAQGAGLAAKGLATSLWASTAALLANPITWVVVAVMALGAAFVYAWQQSAVFRDNVLLALQPVRDAWARLVSGFSGLLDAVLPGASAKFASFVSKMGGFLGTVAYGIGWIVGFVGTSIALIGGFLIAKFADYFGGIVTFLTGAWNLIAGIFTGNGEQIRLGAHQMLDGLRAIWHSALGWIVDLVVDFGGKLWTHITEAVGHVTDWLNAKVGEWKNMGANLIQGLIDGIQSKVAGVLNVVRDLAGDIKGLFSGQMILHSPSRVFMGYGDNIGQGLALGIAGSAQLPIAATRRMADDVTGAGLIRLPNMIGPAVSGQTYPRSMAGPKVAGPSYSPATMRGDDVRGGGTAAVPRNRQKGGIVIHNLTVQASNADDFVESLRRFTEDHQ